MHNTGAKNAAADASNFDKEFTNEAAIDSVVTSTLSKTAQEKSKFEGNKHWPEPESDPRFKDSITHPPWLRLHHHTTTCVPRLHFQ